MPLPLRNMALLLCLLLCMACKEEYDHHGKTPIAQLGDDFLYREDLSSVLPVGLSSEDSTLFAHRFIRNWAEETLLYDKARKNIPDDQQLETLVENYRRALVMHTYRQELIHQKLSDELNDNEVQAYYEANSELFRAERGLVKGLFIKVPLTAPDIKKLRRWYCSGKQDDLDRLEKYQMQHAVVYDYFNDKWTPVGDVLARMPMDRADAEAYIVRQGHVELKDADFYYFLNLTDYCPSGQTAPYDYVRTTVRETLLNVKQVEFMEQVKSDLYERAANRGEIIYY